MMLLAAVIGVLAASGAMLLYSGLRQRPIEVHPRESLPARDFPRERLVRALVLGALTLIVTRWPVAAIGMAALGWFVPELFGSRRAHDRATARTEAIAAWTEM